MKRNTRVNIIIITLALSFETCTLSYISPEAEALWARTVIAGTESSPFYGVAVDGEGNVYAAGCHGGAGEPCTFGTGVSVRASYNDVSTIVKYSANGTAQWANTVDLSSFSIFTDVAVDRSGNVYAVGHVEGEATYGPGVRTMELGGVLVKYNHAGMVQWARTGGAWFTSVTTDVEGNVYVVGWQAGGSTSNYGPGVNARGTAGIQDPILVKYDALGNAQWARTLSSGTRSSIFQGVVVDGVGNAYAVGWQIGIETYSYGSGISAMGISNDENAVIVKYDAAGDAQWARTVSEGTSDSCFLSVAVDREGSILVVGGQTGLGNCVYGPGVSATGISVSENAILVKYDTTGTAQWVRTTNTGYGKSYFTGVVAGENGNVYVVGYQEGNATYGYGPGISAMGSSNSENVVLVEYNASGMAQWVRTVSDGIGKSNFWSVAVDEVGHIYAAGYQEGAGAYFYGSLVSATGTAYNGWNALLVKYGMRHVGF